MKQHEGLSNVIAFVDTEKRKLSVGRLGAGAEDASGEQVTARVISSLLCWSGPGLPPPPFFLRFHVGV
jgi:hypothetical protein